MNDQTGISAAFRLAFHRQTPTLDPSMLIKMLIKCIADKVRVEEAKEQLRWEAV